MNAAWDAIRFRFMLDTRYADYDEGNWAVVSKAVREDGGMGGTRRVMVMPPVPVQWSRWMAAMVWMTRRRKMGRSGGRTRTTGQTGILLPLPFGLIHSRRAGGKNAMECAD